MKRMLPNHELDILVTATFLDRKVDVKLLAVVTTVTIREDKTV